MKIEIVYRDLFEYSGQLLIDELTSEYGYSLIDYGDVMRTNINNETYLGNQIQNYIGKGELIPDSLTFEVIKHEIESKEAKNILIKSYPKNLPQVDLLVNYCLENNIEISKAWYMKGLNTMTNLEKVPKYSKMAAKYKSHDQIKLNSERSKSVNENAIAKIGKYCEVIIIESESHGLNYENDKQRIKKTIHNNRAC